MEEKAKRLKHAYDIKTLGAQYYLMQFSHESVVMTKV
jgi:hypothetical protein